MKSAKEILYELIGTQSDSGTDMKYPMADKILSLVREDDYFKGRPDLCGSFESAAIPGGLVVWALKKGTSSKTLILSGHCDAVEIDSYGALRPYALKPDELRERMLLQQKVEPAGDPELMDDLQNQDWVFGRGGADMKGGIAANLRTLFDYPVGELNILFTAVNDEENLSAGGRLCVHLYRELKDRFGLDYKLAIISEPGTWDLESPGTIQLVGGAAGKIMPVIVARGRLAHSSSMMDGLNSVLIVTEIVRRLEMATDFVSSDLGFSLHPPTTLILRDQKEHYDVSMPQYTAAGFNMPFLNSDSPADLIERVRAACIEAFDSVIKRHSDTYDLLVQEGKLLEGLRAKNSSLVMTLEEMKRRIAEQDPGFESFDKELNRRVVEKVKSGETLQRASIYYVREVIERSGITEPLVVIGMAPPFHPAVSNHYIDRDVEALMDRLASILKTKHGLRAVQIPYAYFMTDMSYMSCIDPEGASRVMDNMGVPKELYNIDFDLLVDLNVPALHIGPAGKAIHQAWERVYLPDVTTNIPLVFKELAALL